MPKDVVVVVNIDAKPTGTESLDILLVSTEGAADCKVYRDLDVINKDFPNKKVAAMAAAMFDQGKTTLAETLIRKIKIVGVATPETSAAVDSLYMQQLDIRIFADEFFRAAIPADSL